MLALKRAVLLALALVGLHLPGDCLAQADRGAPVTVRLSWKFQFEYAPFIVAIEKGYYREANLQVTLKEWEPGVKVVDEVVSGAADFGMHPSSLIVERANGKPVVAIAALMQHSPVALLAKRSAGIKGVLDLAGKRVAFSHDTGEILAFLSANGLNKHNFKYLTREGFGIEMLTENKADAIGVYSTNEPFLTRGREDEYLLLMPQTAAVDFFGNILFTSEKLLDAQPERVAAFRAATLRGLEYALAHQDEVIDLILAQYNSQNKSRDHLQYEATRVAELTRTDIVEPGYMSLRRWQHVADIFAEQGEIPAHLRLDDFFYDPHPKGLSPVVLWILGGTVVVLVIVSGVLVQVRRFNRRLQAEIDERSVMQKHLQDANLHLNQAMGQLAQSEKLASLGALVAGVSHELNTPLGNARVTASALANKIEEIATECASGTIKRSSLDQFLKDAAEASDLLERNLDRAATMIGSFKQVAVDQTSEQRREFDLLTVLTEVSQILRPLLVKARATLSILVEPGILITSYPGPLGQIITNLVNNSLLHGFADGRHGSITLRARSHAAHVVIEYLDDGHGMTAAVAAHAFDPFFTTRMGVGGSGLGLYIVYNLVTGPLGGTVTLETEVNGGVHLTLSLPLLAPESAMPSQI